MQKVIIINKAHLVEQTDKPLVYRSACGEVIDTGHILSAYWNYPLLDRNIEQRPFIEDNDCKRCCKVLSTRGFSFDDGWPPEEKTVTTVVNIKRERADIYIGRPSRFGNPFAIGTYGNRAQVIAKYESYIRQRLEHDSELVQALMDLEGKRLGCYCAPLPCHGNVLIKLIEEYKERR